MKNIFKAILYILIIIGFTVSVYGNDEYPGYSEWSTKVTKNDNEIKAIQYGRKVASEWSEWTIEKPSKSDIRNRETIKNYYVSMNNNETFELDGAKETLLYGWSFSEKRKVTYLYIDVDTYNSNNNSNHEGPPLQLYCDGSLIASIGKHDYTNNWSLKLDASCQYVDLYMSNNNDNGRNKTKVSSSYISLSLTEYSYVKKWSSPQDWRFNEKYERIKGGDNPQQPATRTVYCYPLTYNIYYELNGGSSDEDFIYTYTVLDEVNIPSLVKKGYDYLGFFDSNGNEVNKINVGTYGDIYLYAKFKRKDPTLNIGFTYFRVDEEKKTVAIKEVLDKVNASAFDELEGDITSKIVIEKIEYENKNKTINYPDSLEIDKVDFVNITFSITNSENCKVTIKKKYAIIGQGVSIDDYKDNIKIYPRYINKEYYETLESNSIWRTNEYKNTLIGTWS